MKQTLLLGTLIAALMFSGTPARSASFGYHGRLQDTGKPAEGNYDLELTLYSAAEGGSVIGGPLTLYKVPVSAGSFTTSVDFGPLAKSFDQAWLAVRVRSAGSGEFAALSTRSMVSATDTVSTCPGGWTLGGNAGNPAGSYLGTADSQPLTFEVDGAQVGQITPGGDTSYPVANINFGSGGNTIAAGVSGATIGGGGKDCNSCRSNIVTGDFGTVSGGTENTAGLGSTVAGGSSNTASGLDSTVAGGFGNTASSVVSIVAGGENNTASGPISTVVGGALNTASGQQSIVAGGAANTAGGDYSFTAGYLAVVRDATTAGIPGGDYATFVWADGSTNSPFTSTGPDQFLIQATGGVAMGTNTPQSAQLTVLSSASSTTQSAIIATAASTNPSTSIHVAGVQGQASAVHSVGVYALNNAGGTALLVSSTNATASTKPIFSDTGAYLSSGGQWTNASDRNLKSGFLSIDVERVLSDVVALPITRWFYKTEGQATQHMGPTAQDFHAAFGLGHDDVSIGTVDEGGVALAAIQGLNLKFRAQVEQESARNAQLLRQNAELRSDLDGVLARLRKLEERQGK